MVEDESLGSTVAAELRPDALAALDRGIHVHRPGVRGRGEPAQRVSPSALVSGAAGMLDRLLPGSVRLRGLRLDPVDEAAKMPQAAQAEVVTGRRKGSEQRIEPLPHLAR